MWACTKAQTLWDVVMPSRTIPQDFGKRNLSPEFHHIAAEKGAAHETHYMPILVPYLVSQKAIMAHFSASHAARASDLHAFSGVYDGHSSVDCRRLPALCSMQV